MTPQAGKGMCGKQNHRRQLTRMSESATDTAVVSSNLHASPGPGGEAKVSVPACPHSKLQAPRRGIQSSWP